MKKLSKMFWNAKLEDIKQGYVYNPLSEEYTCLICGAGFSEGRIYSLNDLLYEAKKAVMVHIKNDHSSVFEYLLGMNKKYTGLTEHQKTLLVYFQQGLNDKQIAAEMHGISTSTIRNHRFTFREKTKQAKIYLAIMELLEEKLSAKDRFIEIPRTAAMVDERFAITEKENDEIIRTYFKEGPDGPLNIFPSKEKRKVAILRHLSRRFDPNRKYSEKEINAVLKAAYHDYVTLRRYLIEYGFLDRYADGSYYWVKL